MVGIALLKGIFIIIIPKQADYNLVISAQLGLHTIRGHTVIHSVILSVQMDVMEPNAPDLCLYLVPER